MWTICLQNTQKVVEGTESLLGNEDACREWLKENQVFYDAENKNPITDEDFGSKYVLLDLEQNIPPTPTSI